MSTLLKTTYSNDGDKETKPQDLNNILQDLIEMFGEYECDDEPCETCGDYVETHTWEI